MTLSSVLSLVTHLFIYSSKYTFSRSDSVAIFALFFLCRAARSHCALWAGRNALVCVAGNRRTGASRQALGKRTVGAGPTGPGHSNRGEKKYLLEIDYILTQSVG